MEFGWAIVWALCDDAEMLQHPPPFSTRWVGNVHVVSSLGGGGRAVEAHETWDMAEMERGTKCLGDLIGWVDYARDVGDHDDLPFMPILDNRNMSKSKGWTLQSSLLTLWMEKTRVNNQTKIDDNANLLRTL